MALGEPAERSQPSRCRSARWLRDFGDLRVAGRHGVDPVDWVEMIPFDETRNYVMWVGEALPIYRARIHGEPAPIVPTWDLTGGGLMPAPPLRLTLALSARPQPKPFIGPVLPAGWQPSREGVQIFQEVQQRLIAASIAQQQQQQAAGAQPQANPAAPTGR
mgnify:CR=1 FL=1